jgi:hypothetical protein
MNRAFCLLGLVILAMRSAALCAADHYTNAMFVRALEHGGFVLIRLEQPQAGGAQHEVCVPEAGLIGAIHIQYHLDYDQAGRERARQIALASKSRTFSFTNSKAFDVVKPLYTSRQLADIRKQLAKFSNRQLVSQLQVIRSKIHDLYSRAGGDSYRDAVAHVLLERGILVNEDDRSGRLYAVEAANLLP